MGLPPSAFGSIVLTIAEPQMRSVVFSGRATLLENDYITCSVGAD